MVAEAYMELCLIGTKIFIVDYKIYNYDKNIIIIYKIKQLTVFRTKATLI